MGWSVVDVHDLEGVPVAGPDGMTMIAVGARRGSYEPRGSF